MSTPLRIWLTGASSGIGLELARQLAAAGHQLALSARRAEPLQQLAEQYPGQLLVLPADLTDAASLQRAAHDIGAHWGALDWLILNAGCCEYVEVDEFDPALFRRVMDTNLHGNAEC
ncbi:MAG: SDR family NAD(P)-dependent oxidoreductase, partial [Halopseudomonas yangmingensis]